MTVGRERIRCFLCGRELYLANLPKHMSAVHDITITRDQIYELDYVLRRFNELKEEIFGVDYITDLVDSESDLSTSESELSVTASALYVMQSMSHDFKNTVK